MLKSALSCDSLREWKLLPARPNPVGAAFARVSSSCKTTCDTRWSNSATARRSGRWNNARVTLRPTEQVITLGEATEGTRELKAACTQSSSSAEAGEGPVNALPAASASPSAMPESFGPPLEEAAWDNWNAANCSYKCAAAEPNRRSANMLRGARAAAVAVATGPWLCAAVVLRAVLVDAGVCTACCCCCCCVSACTAAPTPGGENTLLSAAFIVVVAAD